VVATYHSSCFKGFTDNYAHRADSSQSLTSAAGLNVDLDGRRMQSFSLDFPIGSLELEYPRASVPHSSPKKCVSVDLSTTFDHC
jgi:hypothetical protein